MCVGVRLLLVENPSSGSLSWYHSGEGVSDRLGRERCDLEGGGKEQDDVAISIELMFQTLTIILGVAKVLIRDSKNHQTEGSYGARV